MRFNYHNPVKIHFGVKWLEAVENLAQRLKDTKFLLITSQGFSKRGLSAQIQNVLAKQLAGIVDEIAPNPQIKHLQSIKAKLCDFDAIIALGGGSVIDSAKFFAYKSSLTQNFKSIEFNTPNNGAQERAAPIYAFATTSGTSSELTHWATIWDNDAFVKHSLSDEILYPKEAFYDANLSLSLPRQTTIYTALDALSHSFESIWNNNANPISTHYALMAIEIILRDLVELSQNLHSLQLRSNLMLASIYAGLAFSNTQTALAHALSYPLTMRFGTPHGLACSFSLPLLLECLPRKSHAFALLSPFKPQLLQIFDKLEISISPKDYGLNDEFIDEIFSSLNSRAKNGVFDINLVQNVIKQQL